jgi:hypothetical protein
VPACSPRATLPHPIGPGPATGLHPFGSKRGVPFGWEVDDQLVEFGTRLGLETTTVPISELVSVEAAGDVLAAEEVTQGIAIAVRSPQTPVTRRVHGIVIGVVGHIAPLLLPLHFTQMYLTIKSS